VPFLVLASIGVSIASVSCGRSPLYSESPKPADPYLYHEGSSEHGAFVILYLPILAAVFVVMIIATAGSIRILRRRPKGIYVVFFSFLSLVPAFYSTSFHSDFAILTIVGIGVLYIAGIGALRMARRPYSTAKDNSSG